MNLNDEHRLNRLYNLTMEARRIQEQTRRAVSDALTAGASWTEIGTALGVSKQTAHARYGKDRHEVEEPAPEPEPAPSKITDEDTAGTSTTPSLFSDQDVCPIHRYTHRFRTCAEAAAQPVEFPSEDPNFVIPEGEPGRDTHIQCPSCMSVIGKSCKDWVLENFRTDHTIEDDGHCAHWNKHNMTKPYYDAVAAPWVTGWKAVK